MAIEFPPMPPQEDFSPAVRQFLNAFYAGRSAVTSEQKISAIKIYLLKEPDAVVRGTPSIDTDEDELLAFEYFALDTYGFVE